MSTQKNLITLCFAAVFTLGLAACGGGGGTTVPAAMICRTGGADDEPMDGDAAEPTAAEQLASGSGCGDRRGPDYG